MSTIVYIERAETCIQVSLPELLHDLFRGLLSRALGSGLLCYPKIERLPELPPHSDYDLLPQVLERAHSPPVINGEWWETSLKHCIGLAECDRYATITHVSEPSLHPFINEYI